MKKFIEHWYDQSEIKYTGEEPIIAESTEEATKIAYSRHNGNPPAPLLWLEEVS